MPARELLGELVGHGPELLVGLKSPGDVVDGGPGESRGGAMSDSCPGPMAHGLAREGPGDHWVTGSPKRVSREL